MPKRDPSAGAGRGGRLDACGLLSLRRLRSCTTGPGSSAASPDLHASDVLPPASLPRDEIVAVATMDERMIPYPFPSVSRERIVNYCFCGKAI